MLNSSQGNQQSATPTFTNNYTEHHNEGRPSDISDSDSNSPVQSMFAAPPIRSTVLKKMFPNQKNNGEPSTSTIGTSSSTNNDGGLVTKTMFTGTVGSTRRCVECDAINSKMGKKCQQCKAPLQVKHVIFSWAPVYYILNYRGVPVHSVPDPITVTVLSVTSVGLHCPQQQPNGL